MLWIGHAQSQTRVDACIASLRELWNKNLPLSFDTLIVDSGQTLKSELFNPMPGQSDRRYQGMLLRSNELQQKMARRAIGLHATLSFQENLNTPLFEPEEFIVFKRRAIAGFDWDLLHNGFYEGRLRANILKLEREALLRRVAKERLRVLEAENTVQIIRYFNTKKLEVLAARKSMNQRQLEILEKLWATKHITRDDYLKAIQNATDIKAQYNLYESYNLAQTPTTPSRLDLPLLDIDIQALFAEGNLPAPDSALLPESERMVRYQANYLRDVSLKAYTRYNYYTLVNSAQSGRSFVSVGMNLSLPLSFSGRDKREYLALQQQIAGHQPDAASSNTQDVLLNLYYEYQYKLKQFKNLYHKHLVYRELLRTERVKQEMDDLDFNPNRAVLILDDCWSNTIELIDLKQELYKILLDIKIRLPQVDLTEYTHVLTLDNLDVSAAKPPHKAVYVWSDAFRNYNPGFVAEYCELNELSPVLVSYNTTKAQLTHLKTFLAKHGSNDVHLLIGSNRLFKTGLKGYLDTLQKNIDIKSVKGIHLDIEPHTLEGFRENRALMFEHYLDLVREARRFADKHAMKLSVSIPLSYPDVVLRELKHNCDEVYLMAFENTDPDFILRKSEEEREILKSKCVLALRTKDFKTRVEMDLLFKKMGFEKTAYQDLDDLIKFDNNSVIRETGNHEKH